MKFKIRSISFEIKGVRFLQNMGAGNAEYSGPPPSILYQQFIHSEYSLN